MSTQPLRDTIDTFEITVAPGYRALIGFVAALEELDLQVVGFRMQRQAFKASAPTLIAAVKKPPAQRRPLPRYPAHSVGAGSFVRGPGARSVPGVCL